MSDEINVAAITITTGQLFTIVGGTISVILVGCRIIVTLYIKSVSKDIKALNTKFFELERQIDLQNAESKLALSEMKNNLDYIKERLGNLSERLAVARDRLRISDD